VCAAARPFQAGSWAEELRQQYWRRHAFREELARASESLGVTSKGNSMCPGWSGLDQPRPGDFASTAPALLTSPTSTRSSPICRAAVLGQRVRAVAALARRGFDATPAAANLAAASSSVMGAPRSRSAMISRL
jgi:hypothetical protein